MRHQVSCFINYCICLWFCRSVKEISSVDSLWSLGQLHKAQCYHDDYTTYWCFWQCRQWQVLLKNDISISLNLVSRREGWSALTFPTLDLIKHRGPTPADDMTAQIINGWKLHSELQAAWIALWPGCVCVRCVCGGVCWCGCVCVLALQPVTPTPVDAL